MRRFCPAAEAVLDAGCGEGYYLSQLGWIPERWGIDISRDAVRYAAVRDRSAHWLTATAAHLPFADGGFDCVLSMFALTAGAEFARVLRPGGIFVQVLAGQNHLPGLKSIIYPAHVEKEKTLHPALPGMGSDDHVLAGENRLVAGGQHPGKFLGQKGIALAVAEGF